ncbi:hypothetical protein [Colidextribacter sp. OB.20]|uniref:hypothetical protein n=1 Tax=Colidextribacter sp. OB.20 TaxID=2304568 RepID=UPI001371754A|nr:hypothetical protein [Colidextribacter sp. OB.20]
MNNYSSYMKRQEISTETHERLLNLGPTGRRRSPVWARYGALAACAALIIGVGVWRLAPGRAPANDLKSAAQFAPGYEPKPGEKDVVGPEDLAPGSSAALDGLPALDSDYKSDGLPRINYGLSAEESRESAKISMDYAAPEDSTSRELTRDDVIALAGGAEALEQLGWGGFEFTGRIIFDGDGKVWQMFLAGKQDDFFFELELAPDAIPLTCVITEPHAVTEVWGVEVTARRSGIHGEGPDREVWMPESREVEFIANGVGCRFTLYGLEGQGGEVEEMVSRFVQQSVLEGLYLQNVI